MNDPAQPQGLVAALCAFQAKCPTVAFDKAVAAGSRHYKYASLAQIVSAIRAPLAEAGLCFMQIIDGDKVVTRLAHISGETVEATMPLNTGGRSPQEIGSWLTYAKRYSLTSLLGVVADDDDDGEAANGKASKLAASFSMAPPAPVGGVGGPVGLKAQLVASIDAESAAAERPAPPEWARRGIGLTVLKQHLRELDKDLRLAEDLGTLEGLLRGHDDTLSEAAAKLPDWHAAAQKAISDRRRDLDRVRIKDFAQ